jgi:hypothetical protein
MTSASIHAGPDRLADQFDLVELAHRRDDVRRSVRWLPRDFNSPLSTSRATSKSSTRASRPWSTNRVRNSVKIV